jgi:SpoVK/Ycf46/Vps4 family AAA+-type ATPase
LFAVARCYPRSVIFIDEIDSILTQRTESENEASRRLKTEFLVQLDGAGVATEESILVVGATNRPQELDEAARRRLVKRLYIALPEAAARSLMVTNLLRSVPHSMDSRQVEELAEKTAGYSGSDIKALCQDAALGPIRELQDANHDISAVDISTVRPVSFADFVAALSHVRASVSPADLQQYIEWNAQFGSFPIQQ